MRDWLGSSPRVLEAVPPLLRKGDQAVGQLLESIAAVHAALRLDAVNIPEIREEEAKGAGTRTNPYEPRVQPRILAQRIQEELGLPAILNRVVVHRTRIAQKEWFRETYERFGVRNFVLVGGERSSVAYPGPRVPEANELIHEAIDDPALRVGNICIPGRRSQQVAEADRMAAKVRSGARFFTTQVVYHAVEVTTLLEDLAERDAPVPTVPLLVSACPLRGRKSVDFLRFLGVKFDEPLAVRLTAQPDRVIEKSLDHLSEMWTAVLEHVERRRLPTPLGINLAPIGRFADSVVIELGDRLKTLDETIRPASE